mmetsp:Transcript_27118/g.68105  ORF Transcript_27118/g.68105 Transcript_27118/m.68105 type:complete len:374 (+) Transcript_27118:779-1900(+)
MSRWSRWRFMELITTCAPPCSITNSCRSVVADRVFKSRQPLFWTDWCGRWSSMEWSTSSTPPRRTILRCCSSPASAISCSTSMHLYWMVGLSACCRRARTMTATPPAAAMPCLLALSWKPKFFSARAPCSCMAALWLCSRMAARMHTMPPMSAMRRRLEMSDAITRRHWQHDSCTCGKSGCMRMHSMRVSMPPAATTCLMVSSQNVKVSRQRHAFTTTCGHAVCSCRERRTAEMPPRLTICRRRVMDLRATRRSTMRMNSWKSGLWMNTIMALTDAAVPRRAHMRSSCTSRKAALQLCANLSVSSRLKCLSTSISISCGRDIRADSCVVAVWGVSGGVAKGEDDDEEHEEEHENCRPASPYVCSRSSSMKSGR